MWHNISSAGDSCSLCNMSLKDSTRLFFHILCHIMFCYIFILNLVYLLFCQLMEGIIIRTMIIGQWETISQRIFFYILCLAIVWFIWLMRNNIVFQNGNFNMVNILDLITIQSWYWYIKKVEGSNIVFSYWCVDPIACIKQCCQFWF